MQSSIELKKILWQNKTEDLWTNPCKQEKKFKIFERDWKFATYLVLENSKSFPVFEKIITATWASQRIASSEAFLRSPARRLENVTCLLLAFSIFFISILPRPIFDIFSKPQTQRKPNDQNPENKTHHPSLSALTTNPTKKTLNFTTFGVLILEKE